MVFSPPDATEIIKIYHIMKLLKGMTHWVKSWGQGYDFLRNPARRNLPG
jgi:hypothetical protein